MYIVSNDMGCIGGVWYGHLFDNGGNVEWICPSHGVFGVPFDHDFVEAKTCREFAGMAEKIRLRAGARLRFFWVPG